MSNKIERLGYWIKDYLHAAHRQSFAFIYRKPPDHYLRYVVERKKPVILIPGIFEKWHFLKAIADPLSMRGHPIYVIEHLGYNAKGVEHSAKLIREIIEEKELRNIIIIAHSKGGLIGKHMLAFHNSDKRVEKVIAIAAPFGGSHITKFIRHRTVKELSPDSEVIKKLAERKEVNAQIISIYGVFDNHVWPESSCHLEGAKNIQVEVHGHHKILFDKNARDTIISEVEKI